MTITFWLNITKDILLFECGLIHLLAWTIIIVWLCNSLSSAKRLSIRLTLSGDQKHKLLLFICLEVTPGFHMHLRPSVPSCDATWKRWAAVKVVLFDYVTNCRVKMLSTAINGAEVNWTHMLFADPKSLSTITQYCSSRSSCIPWVCLHVFEYLWGHSSIYITVRPSGLCNSTMSLLSPALQRRNSRMCPLSFLVTYGGSKVQSIQILYWEIWQCKTTQF